MIKRTQKVRRRLNDAFYGFGDPEGHFSWQKFIAVWFQIMLLFQAGANFYALIAHPDTLLVILIAGIAPETIKKFLALKYGGSAK